MMGARADRELCARVEAWHVRGVGWLWASKAQMRRLHVLQRDVRHLRKMLWVWKCIADTALCKRPIGDR